MPAEPLSQKEIEDRLTELPGWQVTDGELTRAYRLADHAAAARLVAQVAEIQDELNHHSTLTLGYDTVTLAVNTHDAGGAVTAKDFGLAARVHAIAPGLGAE